MISRMVKAVSFFKRKAGMSVDAFQAYWRTAHPEVVVKLPGIRRYVQSHTLPSAYRKGEPVYDGIAEPWCGATCRATHGARPTRRGGRPATTASPSRGSTTPRRCACRPPRRSTRACGQTRPTSSRPIRRSSSRRSIRSSREPGFADSYDSVFTEPAGTEPQERGDPPRQRRGLLLCPLSTIDAAARPAGSEEDMPERPLPTEKDGRADIRDRRNWGRWGKDDQVGALNLVTPAKRAAAARLGRGGRAGSLSRPVPKEPGPNNAFPAQHYMRTLPRGRGGFA